MTSWTWHLSKSDNQVSSWHQMSPVSMLCFRERGDLRLSFPWFYLSMLSEFFRWFVQSSVLCLRIFLSDQCWKYSRPKPDDVILLLHRCRWTEFFIQKVSKIPRKLTCSRGPLNLSGSKEKSVLSISPKIFWNSMRVCPRTTVSPSPNFLDNKLLMGSPPPTPLSEPPVMNEFSMKFLGKFAENVEWSL